MSETTRDESSRADDASPPLIKAVLAAIVYPWLGLVLAWGVGLTVWMHARYPVMVTPLPGKGFFEHAAIWVLGLGLLLAVIRLAIVRNAYFVWLSAVMFIFLCREIHFYGTGEAVYVGIVGLGVVALVRPVWVERELTTRRVATLFALAFACYLFAVSLDGRWWFDQDEIWKQGAAVAEEALEVTGHVLMLLVVVLSPGIGRVSEAGS